MATEPTQIRIEKNLKKEASELFKALGTDMSGAVNMFLRQCVFRGGLPFAVEVPQYRPEVIQAMQEALQISRDPQVPSYSDMESLKRALEE